MEKNETKIYLLKLRRSQLRKEIRDINRYLKYWKNKKVKEVKK